MFVKLELLRLDFTEQSEVSIVFREEGDRKQVSKTTTNESNAVVLPERKDQIHNLMKRFDDLRSSLQITSYRVIHFNIDKINIYYYNVVFKTDYNLL